VKVIIAGSRHLSDMATVERAMSDAALAGIVPTEVVSGGARGADALGEAWARRRSIPVRVFEARWDEYGNGASPIRNEEMASYGQALVALPSATSRGTRDMLRRARAHGLRVQVHEM